MEQLRWWDFDQFVGLEAKKINVGFICGSDLTCLKVLFFSLVLFTFFFFYMNPDTVLGVK